MSNASLPPAASPPFDSPAEEAAETLRGWLDAGERIAVLLAPRGPSRHEALARLERSLEERFLAERWSARQGHAPRANTVEELRGRRALAIVETGEELGAEGARTLRASLEDPAGARCAVVALAADEAGAVLPALGPGIEVVVLRDARRGAAADPVRPLRAVGAAFLALASIALAAVVVVPRLSVDPAAPVEPAASSAPAARPAATPAPAAAVRPEPALPPVAAAPPAPAPSRAAAPRAASKPAPRSAPARTAPPEPAAPARAASPTPKAVTRRPAPEPAPARTAAARPAAAAPAPAPADGWLVVNAIPRARIHLDGAAIGTTPIVRHRVKAGEHRVVARFDDGTADERTIRVAGDELYLMFDGR